MRLDRLTNKTREALAAAQTLATERRNPELLPEHLLLALLDQDEGVTTPILKKAAIDTAELKSQLDKRLAGFPRVDGGAEPALSRRLRDVLTSTWSETEGLKDEYSSAEHVLLALVAQKDDLAQLLKAVGLDRAKLLAALQQVRGSQRVTDADPEGKFQALEKYTRDIAQLARAGKIDPARDAGARATHQEQPGADR